MEQAVPFGVRLFRGLDDGFSRQLAKVGEALVGGLSEPRHRERRIEDEREEMSLCVKCGEAGLAIGVALVGAEFKLNQMKQMR